MAKTANMTFSAKGFFIGTALFFVLWYLAGEIGLVIARALLG